MIDTDTYADAALDAARLCADCDEMTDDGREFHSGCCPHEQVEDQERVLGLLGGWCSQCGSQVFLSGPEDEEGHPSWEVRE